MAKVVEGHRRYGSAHLKHALVLEPTTNKRAASTTERLRKLSDRYIILARDRYVYNGYKMSETLHAREEIVSELLQHLRGNAARVLLEGVMKSTRQMFAEQEAVQSRLFIIQDVMQNSVQAWLQLHMASSATDHQDRAKS
ncbi:hypothetical protein JHK86_022774 [Glycine max]|nr:hypothetical protein JHK86_022774 [Glycine max]